MSPARFKLFLVEDGEKYVLRGDGHFGEIYTGPKSRSVSGAPEVFVRHLDSYWPWLSNQWNANLYFPCTDQLGRGHAGITMGVPGEDIVCEKPRRDDSTGQAQADT